MWHMATRTRSDTRNSGNNQQKTLNAINDSLSDIVEKFGNEVDDTQLHISTAIQKSIRNLNSANESCQYNKKLIVDIIEKTKNYNNAIFTTNSAEPVKRDLNSLCDIIFITSKQWLSVIDKISTSTNSLSKLLEESYTKPHSSTIQFDTQGDFKNKTNKVSLKTCAEEIGQFAGSHYAFNMESIEAARIRIINTRLEIETQKPQMQRPRPLIHPQISEISSISNTMELVIFNLLKLCQVFEHNLTILLKLCELAVLFQKKSQNFVFRSEAIKSRMHAVTAKVSLHNKASVTDENNQRSELLEIKNLISALELDCPT